MVLAIGMVASLDGVAAADEGGTTDDPAGAASLLVLVIGERASNGLPPLAPRSDVTDIAQGHSRRMAAQQAIFHNDDYFTSATRQRLGASALGENVAFAGTVADAHDELMHSAPHRANILDGRFTIAGFAVSRAANGLVYVTEDFAAVKTTAVVAPAPAPAAPPPAPRAVVVPVTAAPAPAPVPTTTAPAPTTSTTAMPAPIAAAPAVASVDAPRFAVVRRAPGPLAERFPRLPSPMVASLLFAVDAGLLAIALAVVRRQSAAAAVPA
jgi:hypothetical protein